MTVDDLPKVNELYAEHQQIDRAIETLGTEGGQIVSLTVNRQGDVSRLETISTSYITYPAQMISAIEEQLRARQQEIMRELKDFGVTL